MKPEYETQINETFAANGFSLVITSGPKGEVRDNDWPCIAYKVQLFLNGRAIIETDYSLGLGHVKIPQRLPAIASRDGFTERDRAICHTLASHPHVQLADKEAHAAFAAKLAKVQKVQPQLGDVLHSLLSDGEAHFYALSFEEWAANFGYDQDSRKAETIFRKCDEIGRALARGIPAELLAKVREIAADL